MSKQFTNDNFQAEVIKTSETKPVLVDFFASWCGPCKMQAPVIDELAGEIGDKAIVGKVDTEADGAIAQQYGIMSIPTLMVFRNGQAVETVVGFHDKNALMDLLQKHQ